MEQSGGSEKYAAKKEGEPVEQEVRYFSPAMVEELDYDESEKILSATQIHGSPFAGELLTVNDLRQANLAPVLRLRFAENLDMSISPVYQLGIKDYLAATVYVRKDKWTVARSYYLSNSQGAWRYLSQYISNSGKIGWFSKWVSEFAITAPSELQAALAGLETQHPITVENPLKLFAGTARFYLVNSPGSIDFLVDPRPNLLPQEEVGYQRSKGQSDYVRPENLGKTIPPEKQPLFSLGPVAQWEQRNALYGLIQCELFVSADKSLRYQFCRDSLGRAWVANIENMSPITGVGVRRVWVDGGDLMTPAYEYRSQSSTYGNYRLLNKHYVDMYARYLSHIPIIRRYMQSAIQRESNPNLQEKIIQGLVSSATSLEQLYEVLRSIPEGKSEDAQWETSIACIGMFAIGEAKKENITSRYGIRKKVYELIQSGRNTTSFDNS